MFASPEEQGIIVLYSLCIGIVTGLIYELFRFTSVFVLFISENRNKKSSFSFIFRFLLDILFSLIYTLITVIFIYGANNGTVRYYILFFTASGFLLYYFTLGKLFSFAEKKISYGLYSLMKAVCIGIRKLLDPLNRAVSSYKIRKYVMRRITKELRKQGEK